MKGYIKVPFPQVYCDSWRSWLAELILCHVVYKLSPPKFSGYDSLPDNGPKSP